MKVTILATSDVHGHIWPEDEMSASLKPYGLAKAASCIKALRETGGTVAVLDNGDLLQGTAFTSQLRASEKDWAVHPIVACLNGINYDAAVPGNHEFDYGLPFLEKCTAGMNFPYLSANIKTLEGKPFFEPYTILERDGIRIGIIGLTTNHVPRWANPDNICGLRFTDPVQEAAYWVPVVRKKADLVLIAYHGGIECDMDTGAPTEYETGENAGYRLATEIPGIDGLITGHQHRRMAGKCGSLPYVQPGYGGAYVGALSFELAYIEGKWVVAQSKAELVDTAPFAPDPDLLDGLAAWHEKNRQWLDAPLSNLLEKHDEAILEQLHTVMTCASGTGVSGLCLQHASETSLNMRQVLRYFPFPNTFAVMRLTNRELKAVIQRAAQFFTLNEQGRLSPFGKEYVRNGDGIGELFAGLEYEISGADLEAVRMSGEDLAETELVVNNHRALLDDGHPLFSLEYITRELMISTADLLAQEIAEQQIIIPAVTRSFHQMI